MSPVVASFKPTAAAISPAPHFLDFLTLVRVHLENPAKPLLLLLDRVVDRIAGIHHARIHPEEDQLADKRVRHDLEGKRGERIFIGRMTFRVFVVLVHAHDGGHVRWRRQIVDHRIQHGLHTLVLECAAAEHGDDLAPERARGLLP